MKNVGLTVLVVVIAVVSFLAGGRYGADRSTGSDATKERTVLYYVDPMNPSFRSEVPGTAPCGMPLEPVYADAEDAPGAGAMGGMPLAPGAVKVNAVRQQLIGVEVEPVALQAMTYTLRLYGKIVPDETKVYRINASTDSWVRQISDMTTGSLIAKDTLLAQVLAPAFYNAQVTYLVALDNMDRIQRTLGGQTRPNQAHLADNQIRLAVQALQNLGITDAQVEELAGTRQAKPYLQVRSPVTGVVLSRDLTLYQWFKAGEQFFSVADLGRVWVYADVYEDEVMHVHPGMDVKVVHKQMGKIFAAKVGPVLPLFDPIAKTLKVRIDVDSPQYDLRPDMFVDVEIPITLPVTLHLPADAVLDTGTTQVVYVERENGVFEPRRVQTGWRLGRRIQITGGLMAGERVVVSGNFLIDSESRMKRAGDDASVGTDPLAGPGRDPVCGMEVDKAAAASAGRTVTHGEQTLYFCSDMCKEHFAQAPEKYAEALQAHRAEEAPAVSTQTASWTDLLEPVAHGPAVQHEGTFPGQDMERVIRTPGLSDRDVDWGGESEESQKSYWKWGKFPGSEYLGMEEKPKAVPEHAHDADATGSATSPENGEGSPAAATATPPR